MGKIKGITAVSSHQSQEHYKVVDSSEPVYGQKNTPEIFSETPYSDSKESQDKNLRSLLDALRPSE